MEAHPRLHVGMDFIKNQAMNDARPSAVQVPGTSQQHRWGFMYKLSTLTLIAAFAGSGLSEAQPTRQYDDKGAPPFQVLKEGENPPLDAYDNFVIGPKYVPAPERQVVEGVPEGTVQQFVIDSKETKLFNPGISRGKSTQKL